MDTSLPIDGHCDPEFERVRHAFTDNFEHHGDHGAAICVFVNGVRKVDLWGGYSDSNRTIPWQSDTLVSVASVSKAMTALCIHHLVEQKQLDLNRPVHYYWPEFGRAGKMGIPARWLLTHQAGLPGLRRDMPTESLFDWATNIHYLSIESPWWPPGSRHGYHALTYGFLLGELIRRISGITPGNYFHQYIAEPLGADFFIGVPESEDPRIAQVLPPKPLPGGEKTFLDSLKRHPNSMAGRAFLNPARPAELLNTTAWRRAEIPATNGHGSARSIATVFNALSPADSPDHRMLLHPKTLMEASRQHIAGMDMVLAMPVRFGLGFMLQHPKTRHTSGTPFGPNPQAYGHPGTGGHVGFVDPVARVAFGYVCNQQQMGTLRNPDHRWPSLVNAVYQALRQRMRR